MPTENAGAEQETALHSFSSAQWLSVDTVNRAIRQQNKVNAVKRSGPAFGSMSLLHAPFYPTVGAISGTAQ
jgi:hypothetical protein